MRDKEIDYLIDVLIEKISLTIVKTLKEIKEKKDDEMVKEN